jgi:hypothetical protein
MSSYRQLTRSRQSYSLRQSDSSDRVSSPLLEPEAWTSRVPAPTSTLRPSGIVAQTPDLFATLVHNRERAYWDSSIPITPKRAYNRDSSKRHISQRPASPGENRMAAAKIPKKNTPKSRGKIEDDNVKKRPAAKQGKGRAPKITKTESKANIRKKVSNSRNVMATKSPVPDIIDISDSDTDENAQTSSSTFDRLRKLQPWNQSVPEVQAKVDEEAPTTPGPFNSITDDSTNLVQELQTLREELQKVREELQAGRSTMHSLRQEMEKREASALLEKQMAEASWLKELEAEKQKCCEQFQSNQDILAKQVNLETEHTALGAQLEQEKNARKQDLETHSAVLLQSSIKSAAELTHTQSQIQTLQTDKTRLLTDNELLKAKLSTLSPVPSLSLCSITDEDKRENNIRKMYIKTKRQYDTLRSVANDVVVCTRSWDMSCHGDFGAYLRKLRGFLDIDGGTTIHNTTQQTTGVIQKSED